MRMRTLAPVMLVPALMLVGCSADEAPETDNGASGAASCLSSGTSSDAVQVDGEFGAEVTLTNDLPVEASEMQRSTVTEGEGRAIESGDQATVSYTIFNGTSGDALGFVPGQEISVSEEALAPWAYELVRCASSGDRAVLVGGVEDTLGQGTAADEIEGVEKDDALVIVMDITGIAPGYLEPDELLDKADGKPVSNLPAGLPDVELDADGAPTITIPAGAEAPDALTVQTLIEGDGDEVLAGDRVYVNYRGIIWRTGEEFDSSWSRGEPAAFLTTGVIGGFSEALEGQRVGSQVISIVPAEDGGYGAEKLVSMGHESDDVMVFVLDILGTVHPE